MPFIPLAPPLINGNYFDWSSVEFVANNGSRISGFKSVDYKSTQKPGAVFANGSRQKIGRTPGQYDASGSFEIYRPQWLDLQRILQGPQAINNLSAAPGAVPGMHEVNFNMIVSFSEKTPQGATYSLTDLETQTDTLVGCRIADWNFSGSQGSDALTVKCELDIMYLAVNNAIPISQLLKAANFR